MPQNSRAVAAFDFDGTISTGDTFFPFLLYACGRAAVYRALAIGLVGLLIPAADMSVRNRLKAVLVRRLFRGMPRAQLEQKAHAYAQQVLATRMRPKAIERIRWHREQQHRCVMVSASLDIYLRPIARELGFDDLLCTRLDESAETLSGALIGNNCRRAEKVRRLQGLLGDLAQYRIYAYGDSAGDREMLAIAAEQHYRPFL
jgi:phosphatidylglycerophosphatase C